MPINLGCFTGIFPNNMKTNIYKWETFKAASGSSQQQFKSRTDHPMLGEMEKNPRAPTLTLQASASLLNA